jgi:hypothetical protein
MTNWPEAWVMTPLLGMMETTLFWVATELIACMEASTVINNNNIASLAINGLAELGRNSFEPGPGLSLGS